MFNRIVSLIKKKSSTDKPIKQHNEEDAVINLLESDNKRVLPNTPLTRDILETYDYTNIPNPVIVGNQDGKTILLMDDISYTDLLFKLDFKNIKSQYNLDIMETYKVVKCFGRDAGFMAFKYAVLDNNRIDYGIFDLTIGHTVKYENTILNVDGIDICFNIKNNNPGLKYVLCTAHSLNKNSPTILKFTDKLKNGLNDKLVDVYMNKNSDRLHRLIQLLKE